jgi:hypothetical protein
VKRGVACGGSSGLGLRDLLLQHRNVSALARFGLRLPTLRLIIGEVRGGEAFDLLDALNRAFFPSALPAFSTGGLQKPRVPMANAST